MTRKKLPVRTKALLGVLALVGGAWAYSTVERIVLERGLHSVAQDKMGELKGEKGSTGKALALTSQVIATRDYILFGDIHGKVCVYMRDPVAPGQEQYHALEYFLRHDEEGWVLEDSSHNHDPGVEARARAAFASAE